MIVVSWDDFLSRKVVIGASVSLTIGVFDGVHLGHRRLLSAITGENALPTAITFYRTPAMVLAKSSFQGLLLTHRQKIERFEALGIGAVVVIDFSEHLSRLSGKAFIGLLRQNLSIEKLAVGYNFRFGKDRDMDSGSLRELLRDTGIDVLVAEPVLHEGRPVSSSRIRHSVRAGLFLEAERMLGSRYALDLREVTLAEESPQGSLRTLKARRNDIRQCLPKPGSYPVSIEAEAAAHAGLLTVREDSVLLELNAAGKIEEARFN